MSASTSPSRTTTCPGSNLRRRAHRRVGEFRVGVEWRERRTELRNTSFCRFDSTATFRVRARNRARFSSHTVPPEADTTLAVLGDSEEERDLPEDVAAGLGVYLDADAVSAAEDVEDSSSTRYSVSPRSPSTMSLCSGETRASHLARDRPRARRGRAGGRAPCSPWRSG